MTSEPSSSGAPRVFISYSHDTPAHKQWVLNLAIKVRQGGVDATIDQWDLRLGEDLAHFMEIGIRDCDRVIVVLSTSYTQKANEGKGGVGYEKQIVTKQLIDDLGTTKFIPIIRGNSERKIPEFLGYRYYLDFEDDSQYDVNVDLLLREIHGVPPPDKPPLGPNPFAGTEPKAERRIDSKTEKPDAPKAVRPASASETTELDELKELLAEPGKMVRLHDWLQPRVEDSIASLRRAEHPDFAQRPTPEMFSGLIDKYDAITAELARAFAVIGRWANDEQLKLLGEGLARFAAPMEPIGGIYQLWLFAARYPALKLLYAAGIASVHRENLRALKYLTLGVSVKARLSHDDEPLLIALNREAPFVQDFWNWLPGLGLRYFPLSSHLERVLRPVYSNLIQDDHGFVRAFDRLEFLAAVLYGDFELERTKYGFWIPPGSFVWRRPKWPAEQKEQLEKMGKEWPPLRDSYCGANQERALKILDGIQEFLATLRRSRGMF